MKRKLITCLSVLMSILVLGGCGKGADEPVTTTEDPREVIDLNLGEEQPQTEIVESEEPEVAPEGMYRSELTGEWISEDIKNQRPIAVMVDNEVLALPHYGLNGADIVYEMMNSTMNNRVTRFMVIYKDYANITQLGSVRSARPTNFMVAAEYNAILCHDGGPFYTDQYVARDYSDNLSGGFARFSNGKSAEFTEYITYEGYSNPTTGKSFAGLKERIENAKYDTQYNEFYPGDHLRFNPKGIDLSEWTHSFYATRVELNFPHNKSTLVYNEETKTYDYYEYGYAHVDPLDDNKIMSFKNVVIQECSFAQLDQNGYLIYNVLGKGNGYYLTEGKAIPIEWGKLAETAYTALLNKNTGEQIEMNVGKTYYAIVPDDTTDDLIIE